MDNDFLWTAEDLYKDKDHQAHVEDFYHYVATKYGYGSEEWIKCCYWL